MLLDVAAQREQEGLEPRPDPQRSFLTYRLPLKSKQEGGREKDSVNIIITILPHINNRQNGRSLALSLCGEFEILKSEIISTTCMAESVSQVSVSLSLMSEEFKLRCD